MIPLSFYSVPLLIGTAFIAMSVGFKRDSLAPLVGLAGSLGAAGLCIAGLFQVMQNGIMTGTVSGWPAPFGISVAVDQLSIVLVSLVSIIGFLAVMFSQKYVTGNKTEYYTLVMLALAGLMGIMQTGDIFNMFVFFEVMNVSAYALVAFRRDKKSLEAGIKYLIMGAFATSMMLLGIAFLYGEFGTLNIADLAAKTVGYSGHVLPVSVGLLLTGFAIKSGLVPFHAWLPDAHPAAPSPFSAILSGLVIKGGFYAILRIGFTMLGASALVMGALAVMGLLSMVVGGVLALMQTDLKRLLAYSSISQMGYIALAAGLGTQLGMSGALFHIVNHAIIKSLLFLCAGVVIHHAKTADMYKLGGTFRSAPVLTYAFLIGMLSLGGIPFFNGFTSKWLIYIATMQINPLLTVVTLLVTAMTIAYGMRAFYAIFMTNPNPSSRSVRLPLAMSIPLVVLAGLCLLFGLVPSLGYQMTEFMMQGLSGQAYMEAVLG